MTNDPRKDFNAMRLRRMDQLRRDPKQSASARLVGLELFANVNSVSGQAWTAQATLSARLGLDLKTVKRAIKGLDSKYFTVARILGAVNFYKPIWNNEQRPLIVPCDDATEGKKGLGTGGKNGLGTGGKKGLLSPSRIPSNIPARAEHGRTEASIRAAPGNQEEKSECLKGHRDDGTVELKAIELFDKVGLDGFEIVSSLHEIDNGLPRLRLFRLIRGGAVTDNDPSAAALAVREHESRKAHCISIAKRTEGRA